MAKKTRAKEIRTAGMVASELLQVREEMNVLKPVADALTSELKQMMKNGERQDLFRLVDSTSMRVVDAVQARLWAEKYAPQAIIVDSKVARSTFLADSATYSMGTAESHGFKYVTTQQLREVGTKQDIAGELGEIT